jgi:hypothetical protein
VKPIAALVVVLAAVFAASAHADAGRTIYVECFDAAGTDWFVPIDLVERADPAACSPLIAAGPLPPTPPLPDESTAPEPAPDTGGVDVGLDADPNMAPDPSLYATEVRCPDGSIWAVATGDPFVCPDAAAP